MIRGAKRTRSGFRTISLAPKRFENQGTLPIVVLYRCLLTGLRSPHVCEPQPCSSNRFLLPKLADKRFPKGHSAKPALRRRFLAYQPSCKVAHDLRFSADQGREEIDPFLPADLGRYCLKDGSSVGGQSGLMVSCRVLVWEAGKAREIHGRVQRADSLVDRTSIRLPARKRFRRGPQLPRSHGGNDQFAGGVIALSASQINDLRQLMNWS